MINNTMPVPSEQGWTRMLEGSPSLIPDHNKNFFDYADGDDLALPTYDLDKAPPVEEIAGIAPGNFIVEDFLPVEDMDGTYTTVDTKVILTVSGSAEGEEAGGSALIPTTALEMVNPDVPLSHPELNASFLNANLPVPLGAQPVSSSSSFPVPTSPAPTPSSAYPHTPSTPSCQSTCSDDVSSAVSDVSTPSGISGVTSGQKFLFPLPSDDKMAAAALTALETQSLTPLIKEELKYTIQSRRMAAGKPELVVDASPRAKVRKVMTEEEEERALKRREQNRMAAQRFRQKQKDTADVLTKKIQKLDGSNTALRTEVKRLMRESQELRQLLTSHLLVCPKVKVAR